MFKKGDKIIWDSGFYFSTGTYIEPSFEMYDHDHIVLLKEGREISVRNCEIFPIEDLQRIKEKYNVNN